MTVIADLTDKVAIVTGAGAGMGAATAAALARAGASVAVADIDAKAAEATAREIGDRAVAIPVDVASGPSVAAMVDRVVREVGPVDILINNAGIVSHYELLELPEAEWDRVLAVNVKGPLLCTQSVAPSMIAQGGGTIVNMSSIAADLPTPDVAHYGASKAALSQLTKSMALALAPHGIRVNAVQPGTIETHMNAATLADPGVREAKLKIIALDHIGTPEEVADPIVFLCSSGARYITGASLYVDGGAILLR